MVLSCQGIGLSFGTDLILEDISFQIEEKERCAVVGINGAGKSTLLNIISGALTPDKGEVIIGREKSLGYLAQYQDISSDETVFEAMMNVRKDLTEIYERLRTIEKQMHTASGDELEKLLSSYDRLNHIFEQENGYALNSEVTGILKGLGFSEEEFDKKLSALSGGQRTRVFLGKLLLTGPDIIMLDEPTNHLDMNSAAWLEGYLSSYRGTVIIVSHDRYFLDRIATKIIEIEGHKSSVYKGNYTDYSKKKAMLRDAQLKAWLKQQDEIKHQQEVIRKLKSFNREKSIKRAESREKSLEKMEILDAPLHINEYMHLTLSTNIRSGNEVLHAEGLAKSFADNNLFDDLSIDIRRGEHVAIIGDNGTGKTTILKMINGLIPPDRGIIKLGSNVHIGYYDQEQHFNSEDNSIMDEISDDWPDMNQGRIRNVLASFLFTGDDVYKSISSLSGGERARVALAKLMLSDANLLILDEPTNHLDIASREILERALCSYDGTVLYVSHDRYFINVTASRILELSGKTLTNYLGNFDYYLEKKDQIGVYALRDESSPAAEEISSSKKDYLQQKEELARERKRENDIKKTLARIEEIDTRLEEIDSLLSSEEIYTDHEKALGLSTEREKLEEEQLTLISLWESLEEQATS